MEVSSLPEGAGLSLEARATRSPERPGGSQRRSPRRGREKCLVPPQVRLLSPGPAGRSGSTVQTPALFVRKQRLPPPWISAGSICLSGSREGQHSLRRDTESRWALWPGLLRAALEAGPAPPRSAMRRHLHIAPGSPATPLRTPCVPSQPLFRSVLPGGVQTTSCWGGPRPRRLLAPGTSRERAWTVLWGGLLLGSPPDRVPGRPGQAARARGLSRFFLSW